MGSSVGGPSRLINRPSPVGLETARRTHTTMGDKSVSGMRSLSTIELHA